MRLSVRARRGFFKSKILRPVRCGFKKTEILRCGSVRFSGIIVNPTVRFGFDISHGAVRCGFQNSEILRSVRFGAVFRYIVNPTVRFGFAINPTAGSVRFSKIGNPMVRFGAVLESRRSYRAVQFFSDVSYGLVRFGSQQWNQFFYGAVPIPVGKTVEHTLFFTTVHRIHTTRY